MKRLSLLAFSVLFAAPLLVRCTPKEQTLSQETEKINGSDDSPSVTQEVKPLSETLNGSLYEVAVAGGATGRQVVFSLYLPEGYNIDAEARYPVVYHLHGIGGSHAGNQRLSVPASFERARSDGLIGGVIIIFPDGYTDTFWGDPFDGSRQAETNIVREIIPWADANYRTATARFVQGFSMGGYGAIKLIAKYPDMFDRAFMYDAAIITDDEFFTRHRTVADSYYDNDRARYGAECSPWTFIEANAALFQRSKRIGMAVGALAAANQNMHDKLVSLGIPHYYHSTPCGHEIACLLETDGAAAAGMFGAAE
jgi:enterochelin esterase-like enzyme